MEIKIALIEVLRKYKFVQAPDTEVELKDPTPACDEQLSDIDIVLQVPLQTIVGLGMRPKNGVYLKISPRD